MPYFECSKKKKICTGPINREWFVLLQNLAVCKNNFHIVPGPSVFQEMKEQTDRQVRYWTGRQHEPMETGRSDNFITHCDMTCQVRVKMLGEKCDARQEGQS